MENIKTITRPNQIILFVFGLLTLFSVIFFIEFKDVHTKIDSVLCRGASNIKYYMGEDFVNKKLNKNTLTSEEALEKFSFLHEKALLLGLDYYYILMKDDNDIVYAAVSETKEELQKVPNAGFWFSLKESGDDSFDETWEAFESSEPVYIESSDMWGSYRSVYIPEVSKDGIRYIAGADITTSSLNKQIFLKTMKTFIIFLISMFFIVPVLFLSKKNIKAKKKLEKYITFMDNRDRLTTAYSRDYGLKLLSDKIKEFHTEGKSFSICLVNIDNLRFINESRGMDVGDCLLIIVHRLLVRISRKTDTIVRVEGNKFMIILPGFLKKFQGKKYDTIEKKIAFFNKNNKKGYFLRLNYIICEYYDGSMKDFFEESIQKLKKLKKNGGMEDLVLKDDISRGIKNLEFKTFFQPKVYFEEEKVGFEALVRWFHPEKGVISPNIFIPIAEESYLINKITEIVLNDSLDAAEILKTNISINLSAISFENNYFLSSLQKKIDDSRNKNYITFELTERIAVTNFEDTLDKINKFKKSGVSFSIDDFGSGYSSLSYIEKLPINELKIDKSFIDNINTSLVNPIIIELITKIGRVAGFKTVCEGVETQEQIEKLISLGSDSFQGYYFGKPEPLLMVVERYEKGEYHSKLRQFL